MKHIYGLLRIFAFRRRIATSHFHFRQLFALSHRRPKGVRGSNETPCLPMPSVRVWNYYHKNILELTVSAWYLLWFDWLQVYFLSRCIIYYIYLVLNIFSHSFLRSPSAFIQLPTEPKVKQFNQSWVFALHENVIKRLIYQWTFTLFNG